jgi:hypothetical protein
MEDSQIIKVILTCEDGTVQECYKVNLWRGNILVLTKAEWFRGLARGKWLRRRQTEQARAERRQHG